MSETKNKDAEITKTLNKIIEKLNSMEKKLDGALEENRKLREEMRKKDEEIKNLRKDIDALQQRSRINNVEIGNFPITKDENLVDVVIAIANKVGVQLGENDIQAVHRVPRFKKDATKNVVVQFCSRWKKNILLNACATFRKNNGNKMTAKQVKPSLADQPIYVSEHLTPKNKALLKKTKDKAKSVQWKYVWTKDGSIFMRKDETDRRRIPITQEEDLVNLQ